MMTNKTVNKKVAYVITGFTLLSLLAIGVNQVNASFYGLEEDNIISTLSQKLGVSEDKVQKAFDEIHNERHDKMETQYQNMLSQAVKDGKLSDAQMQLLISKHNELFNQKEANAEEFKNMTPQERRDEMKKHHDELEAWAKENNIDPSYLFGLKKGHRMMGMKMGMH
jgi:hypothetical protein